MVQTAPTVGSRAVCDALSPPGLGMGCDPPPVPIQLCKGCNKTFAWANSIINPHPPGQPDAFMAPSIPGDVQSMCSAQSHRGGPHCRRGRRTSCCSLHPEMSAQPFWGQGYQHGVPSWRCPKLARMGPGQLELLGGDCCTLELSDL